MRLTDGSLWCRAGAGVFLQDLTFIDQGNADSVGCGLVDLGKRRNLYGVLELMQRYREPPYHLQSVPEITALLRREHMAWPEERIHAASRELD